jgi:hypothetical protein
MNRLDQAQSATAAPEIRRQVPEAGRSRHSLNRVVTNPAAWQVAGTGLCDSSSRAEPDLERIGLGTTLSLLEDPVFFLRHPRRYRQISSAISDRDFDRGRMVRLAAMIHAHLAVQARLPLLAPASVDPG